MSWDPGVDLVANFIANFIELAASRLRVPSNLAQPGFLMPFENRFAKHVDP